MLCSSKSDHLLTIQGTVQFHQLISAFCKMLDNLPHDQAFSQLIVNQMETYSQKCYGWYKALVSRSQAAPSGRLLKAPAMWAESVGMEEIVSHILQAGPSDREQFDELIEKETTLLIQAVEEEPLDQADMVQDKKMLANLCLLHTSMKWLATKTAQLRHISDRATDSVRGESVKERHNQRWTLLSSSEPRADGAPVYLPLNTETVS
jgi:exocyst complex component 4